MKTSLRSLATVAVVGMLALSACESDPSPTRVARDLVETETAGEPEIQACMLDVIDQYDLDQLGADAAGDNADKAKAADAELVKFEADLAACR